MLEFSQSGCTLSTRKILVRGRRCSLAVDVARRCTPGFAALRDRRRFVLRIPVRWIVGILSVLVLGGLIITATPTALNGQTRLTVGTDAALKSRYVWRGLTRRNDWVLQADLMAGLRSSGSFVTVGGWTNVELATADPGSSEIGLGRHLGEGNVWAEVAWWVGAFDFAVGYTRYFFDRDAAAAAGSTVFNTGEFYGDAQVRVGPVVLGAAAWLDVEEVKGAYFELDATYRVPVFPLAVPALYLGVLGGISEGQAVNEGRPEDGAYFAKDGLTHIEISTSTQIYTPIGPLKDLYATPTLYFQVNLDEDTKRDSRSPDSVGSSTKWWFSLAVSWYH